VCRTAHELQDGPAHDALATAGNEHPAIAVLSRLFDPPVRPGRIQTGFHQATREPGDAGGVAAAGGLKFDQSHGWIVGDRWGGVERDGFRYNFPMKQSESRVVYSTGSGRVCPGCGFPTNACRCKARAALAAATAQKGPVRVARQTAGRGGKGVSVITGLGLPPAELEALAKALKQRCGTGGRVVDGVIEIQGEHRDTLVEELKKRGIDAKRAGG
jgi:translation initiation factor 1